MKHAIFPVKLGVGIGRFVVNYPVQGEVVHACMDYENSVILWVRCPIDADTTRRALILAAAGHEIPSDAKLVNTIQFEVQIQEGAGIVLPGQNGAQPRVVRKQVLVFVLDDGATDEPLTAPEASDESHG